MIGNSSQPKILFVAHTAKLGGPAHSLLLILQHLKHRYETMVLLPEQGAYCELLESAGIRHFVIPRLGIRSVPAIYHLLKEEKIDLVYGNTDSGASRNSVLAAKLARIPSVWHFRAMKHHWTWRQGWFVRLADEVVAVSKACAQSFERFRPGRDVRVIYNGVDLDSFPIERVSSDSDAAARLGLPPDARCLISVSQLVRRKGHEDAVEAMRRVVQQYPNAHLLLAGAVDREPEYTATLRELITKHGLDENIHLLGFRTDMPELLAGSEALIHTAYRDPHPRAVLEAMASGLPVVGFGVDGVAETVVDGVTGYLVPSGDRTQLANAMERILASPDGARQMGRQGREHIEKHFVAEQTAERIGQVIAGLLNLPTARNIELESTPLNG